MSLSADGYSVQQMRALEGFRILWIAPGRVSHAMSHSVTSWAHRGCCCRDIWWREACRGKDSAGRDAGWVQRTGLGDRRSRVQISAARQKNPRLLASFELVVVAVGVVGAFVVFVFVDENTVLVGETFPAVLAAATPNCEQ